MGEGRRAKSGIGTGGKGDVGVARAADDCISGTALAGGDARGVLPISADPTIGEGCDLEGIGAILGEGETGRSVRPRARRAGITTATVAAVSRLGDLEFVAG